MIALYKDSGDWAEPDGWIVYTANDDNLRHVHILRYLNCHPLQARANPIIRISQ